jgi:hypothetical protein
MTNLKSAILGGLLLANGLNSGVTFAQDVNPVAECVDNIQMELSCNADLVQGLMHQVYGPEYISATDFSEAQMLEGFTTGTYDGGNIFPLITANEIATNCGDVLKTNALGCVNAYLNSSTSTDLVDLGTREITIGTGDSLETTGPNFHDMVNGGSGDTSSLESTLTSDNTGASSGSGRTYVASTDADGQKIVGSPMIKRRSTSTTLDESPAADALSTDAADTYTDLPAPIAMDSVKEVVVTPAADNATLLGTYVRPAEGSSLSVSAAATSDLEELKKAYSVVIPNDARVIWMDFDNPYLWDLAADIRVGDNDLVLDTEITFCSTQKKREDTQETNNELARYNYDFYTGALANHFKEKGESDLEALVTRIGNSFLSDGITHVVGEHCYDVTVRISSDGILGDNIGSILTELKIPKIPVIIPGDYTGCDIPNIAPTVSAEDIKVYAGELASGRINSNDPDKGPDPLFTSLTDDRLGLYNNDKEWRWQTSIGDVGEYEIKVSVDDSVAITDADFTVTVLPQLPTARTTPTLGGDPTPPVLPTDLEGMLGGDIIINQEGCGNVVILENGGAIIDGTTYEPGTLPSIEIDCRTIYNIINGDGTPGEDPIPAPTEDPVTPQKEGSDWMNLSRFRLSAAGGLTYMNLEETSGTETGRTLKTWEPFISPSLTIPLGRINTGEGSTLVPFISGEYKRAWDLGDTPALTQSVQGDVGLELETNNFNFAAQVGLSFYNSDSVDEAGDIVTTHSISGRPFNLGARLSAPYFFAEANMARGELEDAMNLVVGDSTQDHNVDLAYQAVDARVGTWFAGDQAVINPYLGVRTSSDDIYGSITEQDFSSFDFGVGAETEVRIGNSPLTIGADLSWYPYSRSSTDNTKIAGPKAGLGGEVNLTLAPKK